MRYTITALALASCLVTPLVGTSQKVDLDKFHYDVSYIRLPREYVPTDRRTIGVRVDVIPSIADAYPRDDIYDKIQVSGYEKVERDPTVGVSIRLTDFQFVKSEIETRKEDVKDRDGKVTGTNYYYRQIATYEGRGSYQLLGPKNDVSQAGAKPIDAPANRFLAKATASASTAEANPTQAVTGNGSVTKTLTYRSGEYRSSTDASRAFRDGQESIRRDLINDFVKSSIQQLNNHLADLYGYVPTTERDHMWILDSEKHPEYTLQQEAIKAVQTLTKNMRATESVAPLASDLQPLIEYFEGLKAKYAKDEKPDRKMRYSAFFNLGRLYLLLDQPDKAIAEGEGLIKNDYDTGDGERIIKEAQAIKQKLEAHHMGERHMKL